MIRPRDFSPLLLGLLATAAMGAATLFCLLVSDPLATAMDAEAASAPAIPIEKPPRLILPPLVSYAAISERPLFNPGRAKDFIPPPKPVVPAKPQLPPLTDYRLVGLAVSPDTQRAMVSRASGAVVTLKPGDTLDGRTVSSIGPDGITLSADDHQETLAFRHAGTARVVSAQANQ